MKRGVVLLANLFAVAALVGLLPSKARATFIITYVSIAGTDANDCSNGNPCRQFQRAHDQTTDGGTIQCLDAGHFGPLAITKTVTVDCLAGGGTNNAQGITINAPAKSVKLRNLSIQALNPGCCDIIEITAAATVSLENVFVARGRHGIYDHRAGPVKLVIANSTSEGSSTVGILIVPASGSIGVVLDNVRSSDNSYGLAVGIGGRVMISRSVFSWNLNSGIEADAGAVVSVDGTQISFNSIGLQNGGTMQVSNSGILSNSTAVSGAVQSYGNNRVFANSGDGTPLTSVGGLSSENGQR